MATHQGCIFLLISDQKALLVQLYSILITITYQYSQMHITGSADTQQEKLVQRILQQRIRNQKLYQEQLFKLPHPSDPAQQIHVKQSELSQLTAQKELIKHKISHFSHSQQHDIDQGEDFSLVDWIEEIADHRYAIETKDQKFIVSNGNSLLGNATGITYRDTFTIEPLFTFVSCKKKKWVCAEQDGEKPLHANRDWNYIWETFELIPQGGEGVAMRSITWKRPYIGLRDHIGNRENVLGYRKQIDEQAVFEFEQVRNAAKFLRKGIESDEEQSDK